MTKQETRAYLQRSIEDTSRFEIENHLIDCPLCAAAVEGYVSFPDEIQTEESSPNKRSWFYLAAASLLLLIGSLAFWSYHNANLPGSTFAEFYQKPKWEVQIRGENKSSLYSESITLYNQEYFDAALANFEKLITTYPEDNRLRLYMGVAYLESDNITASEKELQTVRINSEIYYEEATWYLALLKVKTNHPQEAILLLNELIKLKDGFYHNDALQLKNELQG